MNTQFSFRADKEIITVAIVMVMAMGIAVKLIDAFTHGAPFFIIDVSCLRFDVLFDLMSSRASYV